MEHQQERSRYVRGSAGAQICMWLAFTDDMAKPDSADPIERESTRLTCVVTAGSILVPANGEQDPEKFLIAMLGAKTLEEANETTVRHAALNTVFFMSYGSSPGSKPPSVRTKLPGWLIHHVNLGIALKEKTAAIKHEAHLNYPGAKCKYKSQVEFFKAKLLAK